MDDYALIGVTAMFSAIATLGALFLYEWLMSRTGGPRPRL